METRNLSPHAVQTATEKLLSCPQCGSHTITTTIYPHVFPVGSGNDTIDLEVQLPARHCHSCDFGFLDSEAEEIKHEAVCHHLGVLSPNDIRRIRESYAMSRSAFADLTGFGEASLGRWENGIVIQNLSNDRFLRLLASPWIMRRLEMLRNRPEVSTVSSTADIIPFRKLHISEDVLREQASFDLRLAG